MISVYIVVSVSGLAGNLAAKANAAVSGLRWQSRQYATWGLVAVSSDSTVSDFNYLKTWHAVIW